MSAMVETENLGRHFGALKAVDGVTLQVKTGDVLGFLGPNGAGKSTTMKMLTCFLTPSFGTAKVDGFDVVQSAREVRQRVGYLPENAPIYGEMEVHDFLKFVSEVRGIDKKERKSAVERVVGMTSLESVMTQRIETLSKGFKRRVGLAQALIHDPEILILDEPTDGLDPNQKYDVRMLIRKMGHEKCIILSTHILEEVDEVCNRVAIIARGKIVADCDPDDLRARSQLKGAVTLAFGDCVPEDIRLKLGNISGVKEVREKDSLRTKNVFTLIPDKGKDILSAVTKEMKAQNWSLNSLHLESGQLDEVFREITQ